MYRRNRLFAATLAIALAATFAAPLTLADPPAHAPAHGWRAKHDPYYVGYTGHRWDRDYGIRGGRCNRDEVGTVVGAVLGGAVGATVYKGDSKLIAVLVGATIGAIIGREIGRDMDDSDRACFGHALELAKDGQRIAWSGARPGLAYTITPGRGVDRDGRSCRRFTLEREYEGRTRSKQGVACRVRDGEWQLSGD